MTLFQQKFITQCLQLISQILSNELELADAVTAFTQNDLLNPRYQLNAKIVDAIYWGYTERLHFSAAYSEAIYRAINSYITDAKVPIDEIETAKQLLEKNYIPRITSNTKANQRTLSVIENITAIKADEWPIVEKHETEIQSKTETMTSLYGFFYTQQVTTGLLLTATVAAAAYLSSRE